MMVITNYLVAAFRDQKEFLPQPSVESLNIELDDLEVTVIIIVFITIVIIISITIVTIIFIRLRLLMSSCHHHTPDVRAMLVQYWQSPL